MPNRHKPAGPQTRTVSNLLHQLSDKSAPARANALESLVGSGYPQSLDVAIKILGDKSSLVRTIAVEIIGALGNKRTASHLNKRLADPNGEVRMRAAESLGVLLKNGRSSPALINALKDSDELVRVTAAESLGLIGDRRALTATRRALQDASPLVRSYAADAVGQLGDKRDVVRLKKELQREKSELAKVGFHKALYILGEHQILKELLRLLIEARDYRARCSAANTLSEIPLTPSDKEIAARYLRRALRKERTTAARSSIRSSMRHMEN